ncbi:uncharacterized protein LOC133179702 [Saccostrea echinata]|uniref:uncharacterized protein LOC133179702 n=1 Tax=Saccostrea echinata TaxID=191078 RepID=UPI002A827F00|nr:uncharacterized protein LOC133179702 [Saccostrea echinata]
MSDSKMKGENSSQVRGPGSTSLPSAVTGALSHMSVIDTSLRAITAKMDAFNTLQESVNNMQKDLWNEDGLDDRITYIAQQHEDNQSEIETLKMENVTLRKELQLLKSIVVNLDRRVTKQEKEIVDLRERSMKDNILIHNLPEEDNENLNTKVHQLISEHLKLDVNFIKIHRNGPRLLGIKPRTITGKLQDLNDKDRILTAQRAVREKDKKEKREKITIPFYITPQTPVQINESRRRLREINTQYRSNNVETKIIGNKVVFPNGNVFREKVTTPRAEDLLFVDEAEEEKFNEIEVVQSDSIHEGGNVFTAVATKVNTYAEVRHFYKKVMSDPNFASAHHNVLAYRIQDAQGNVRDGYCDDDEYGAGRRVVRLLGDQSATNVAFVISRKSGNHIGPRRFDIICDAVLNAANKL